MNFRKDKEDANAPEIIASLRAHGYEVVKCERPVDLHISDGKRFGWCEVKAERSMVKRGQLEFLSECRAPGTIVASEGEALVFASDFLGWTEQEKNRVVGLLRRNLKMKQFTQKQVSDALKGIF